MKKLKNFLIMLIAIVSIATLTFLTGKTVQYIQEFKEANSYHSVNIERLLTPTNTLTPTPKPKTWTGTASWYSREGCIGCSPTLTMANGQPLDDDSLTVAFNRAKLGSRLLITNLSNGKSAQVIVTDTGEFERHNRIIDVTLAVRDKIGMSGLAQVKIELIN